jgi:hypothetical protein
VINGSNFDPSLSCALSYRQNASTMLPLSGCVVVNSTRLSATVPLGAPPCSSCPLAVTFSGYAAAQLIGSANIAIVATPRINVVKPVNMPIGTSGTVPLPVIGGVNFPLLPCRCLSPAACSCLCIFPCDGNCFLTLCLRGTVCNTTLQDCNVGTSEVIYIRVAFASPACTNTNLESTFCYICCIL